jgi:subtilisin family serine protease
VNNAEIVDNGKDDDGNGYVDDLYGYDVARLRRRVASPMDRHRGTWVCGLVAGDGSGGTVTGAAPRARLMLLKAQGSHVAAMLALQYAIDNGADIIHMDLSFPRLGIVRGVWRRMCEQATCAGLLVVCPAPDNGYNYRSPHQMHTPADVPCVITVSGISPDRQVPAGVARGPVVWEKVRSYEDFEPPAGWIKPDLVGFRGPGVRLVRAGQNAGYLPSNAPLAANVFASARVAGIAALVCSARPSLPAWQLKEILEGTATDLDPAGKDNHTGAGLVNAYAAATKLLEQ